MIKIIKLMEYCFITSLKGMAVILLILATKAAFKYKLNTKFHYYIWFVLILRLCIPYSLESNFSVLNVLNPILEQKTISNRQSISLPKDNISINSVKVVGHNSKVKSKDIKDTSILNKEINYKNVLCYIWLSGIVILILYILIGVIKVGIIKKSAKENKKHKFIIVLNDCRKIMNIDKKVILKITDKIDTPCLYGIIRPTIFLPANVIQGVSEEEFKYIIIHELSHLKRKDIFIKWIRIILNIIYWFNPIIRYGFYKMSEDCEISCDEYAIKYLKNNEIINYGNAIIKVSELSQRNRKLIGTTSMVINKSEIKRRIIMISKYKKVSIKNVLCGALIIAIVAAVGLTNNKSKASINNKLNISSRILSDKIAFKNENLEDVVRAKINKPTGDILKRDVDKIEELSVTYTAVKNARSYLKKNNKNYDELSSLEGIEYLTNLKSLDLNLSFASDISPLKNLSKLKELNISRNYNIENKDISALSGLVNLQKLDISSNQIKDLSPLKNMRKLKMLNLYSNAIEDLTPIKELNQMEELNLSGSSRDGYNRVKDISVLKNFKMLRKLDINNNPVNKKDIVDLKKAIPNCYIEY